MGAPSGLPSDYSLLLQMFELLFFSFSFLICLSRRPHPLWIFMFLYQSAAICVLLPGIHHHFWATDGLLSCMSYSLVKPEDGLIQFCLLLDQDRPVLFFSPIYFFISWRLITLQYCSGFCPTLTWISHGFTCVPHPDPPSHLPFHPILLGFPSIPGQSTCLMHPTWAGDLFHPR